MPWEALSVAMCPSPLPSSVVDLLSVSSDQSQLDGWAGRVGRFVSPLSHLDQEGEWCSMAGGGPC